VTFRERMRPHVQKAAARKHVDLVMEPVQVYQVMNNAADLTDAVIEEAAADFSPDKNLIDTDLLKTRGIWIDDEKAAPAPADAPVLPIPAP
jgi:hypothetical protein